MPKQHRTSRTTKLTSWIIGAVVLVALIWIFSSIIDMPQSDADIMVDTLQSPNLAEGDTGVGGPVAESADQVTAFAQFARRDGAAQSIPDQQFAGEGILHLADAIYAIADRIEIRDIEYTRRIDILRNYGQQLQRSSGTAHSADTVRRALMFATEMMTTLQERFPSTAQGIADARRTAEQLRPAALLSEQLPQVEEYFRLASATLSTMARP